MARFTHNLNIISRCTQMQRTHQFKDLGLCGGQAPYLLTLGRLPGITQEELARELYINKSTAMRAVGHLEKAGFVERRPSPEDRRCLMLYLTDKGYDALPRVRDTVRDWNDYLLSDFSPEERARLIDMMDTISQRAQNYIRMEEGWSE